MIGLINQNTVVDSSESTKVLNETKNNEKDITSNYSTSRQIISYDYNNKMHEISHDINRYDDRR